MELNPGSESIIGANLFGAMWICMMPSRSVGEGLPLQTCPAIRANKFARLQDWLVRIRPALCRAVPAIAIVCFLAWCYVSIRSDFSWDDAEPEVLSHAWRMANGRTIYNGITAPPFNFAAYPPLYYWVLACLMKFSGLSFLPAKLLSFLSALSIGVAIVWLGRAYKKSKKAALLAACILFLIPAFLYNAVRAHVQMMAVALSIWSLVFFLRNRRVETLIISPLLAVLAFYTKQTQIALPLAMVTYLAFRNRRWLIPYAAAGGMACLIPLVWLQRTTHGLFLFDIVRLTKLSYSGQTIPLILIHHAGPISLFIALALLASWRRFRTKAWNEIDCYLVWTFLVTVISLGRPGAHGQYVLELLVVTLAYLVCIVDFPAIGKRSAWVSAQILILFIYAPLFVLVEEGRWDLAANRAAQKIYPIIKTTSGPIVSQQGSFALFGRGEIHIQLFHFAALSRAGLWDQSLFLREIENHTFSWVITEFPIEKNTLSNSDCERFTPEMLQSLRRNYQRNTAIYPYYLYVPRSDSMLAKKIGNAKGVLQEPDHERF